MTAYGHSIYGNLFDNLLTDSKSISYKIWHGLCNIMVSAKTQNTRKGPLGPFSCFRLLQVSFWAFQVIPWFL
jgi:hypothetical protein